ncbi:MAG TPA: DUF1330 domain-containing protein [Dehalococcoidia bacterium]|nr:DUF1330 domain-containing protein [Dehalococcoidia bacterium]HIK98744.1 DUF1330 domain-containing protein [Dehalococcoidia bacterium]
MILEFPTREDADRFYNPEEYQSLLALRERTANIIVLMSSRSTHLVEATS